MDKYKDWKDVCIDKDKLVNGRAYKIYFRDCCIEGELRVKAVFVSYSISEDYEGDGAPAEHYSEFPKDRGYDLYNFNLIFDIGEFSTHNAMYFEEYKEV